MNPYEPIGKPHFWSKLIIRSATGILRYLAANRRWSWVSRGDAEGGACGADRRRSHHFTSGFFMAGFSKNLVWLVVGGVEHQFYFPRNIGNFIIPIGFHIFQRGSNHQPVVISILVFLQENIYIIQEMVQLKWLFDDGFCVIFFWYCGESHIGNHDIAYDMFLNDIFIWYQDRNQPWLRKSGGFCWWKHQQKTGGYRVKWMHQKLSRSERGVSWVIGVPRFLSSIFDGDFSWNKPSISSI